jgi:hypothetical protein
VKKNAYILLDRSGSMESTWKESLGGINSYVREIGEANVMLAAFDSVGYDVIRNAPTSDWVDVTRQDVYPRGGTPLLDAAGRIMWNMYDSGADRAILIVVTDGHENSSVKFRADEIKRYTADLRDRLKYEIVFLGANFDGIRDVALGNFGVTDHSRFMSMSGGIGTAQAFNSTATASASYLHTGTVAQNFYSDADKERAKK